jgi:hypothetical protein
MNNNYNQIGNKKLEKLVAENTAFKNCREDMSDVSFEIGKSSYTAKIFGAIAFLAVFYGARILARRYVGNPDMTFSTGDILFWCFIGLIIILVIFTVFKENKRPSISVLGKTLFYNGDCWSSNEISCVKCTKWFERVEVYSGGKKVLTFPWEMDNSELFIAWVKKCGIAFEDNRMKFG